MLRRWIPTPPPIALGDMHPDASEEILTEMQPEERAEVAELMNFQENTAAGRMTTEYMALGPNAKVEDSIENVCVNFEGGVEKSVSTVNYIVDQTRTISPGAVPLAQDRDLAPSWLHRYNDVEHRTPHHVPSRRRRKEPWPSYSTSTTCSPCCSG